jgi:hypothetical protein
VEDLFSPNLSLMLLCPNGQHEIQMNLDKFVPHPGQSSPAALRMFEFVGRLIGISLRTQNFLNYALPGLIWKAVLGQPLSVADLKAVDAMAVQSIEAIRHCERDGITDGELFDDAYTLGFTTSGADGREVELLPGGAARPVTYANRGEYCDMALRYRLHEFDAQCDAMRRGLAALVPERALRLFTWKEVDILACGDPTVNVQLLKAHTVYPGWSAEHECVAMFWAVFDSFSDEDRSKFIRFAWGRSRLPRADNWGERPFKLTKKNGGDNQLPLAHTWCAPRSLSRRLSHHPSPPLPPSPRMPALSFFQIELPCYSSEEVMRRRVLAAVHYGMGEFLMA